ncbi:alpha/beta fold hydrolase [Plantibacter sp. M259]|uniref:alpha/beta fold hydrolase n=1 Tax=Plantibacter sp. M259 TaxID=2583822 RepID=UPI003512E953
MTHRTTTSLLPGIHVTDHTVDVPLDWRRPDDGRTISLFARELVDPLRRDEQLPVLVFLQGGPGGKGPRPVSRDGWIAEALRTFRLVLLDQRGTGRSTRIDGRSIAAVGDPAAQAEYLERFRADSIVDDAEYLRRTVFGGRRWSTLGQSYGGFLTLTYLSRAPEGLAACYVTGGLAGIHPSAAEVYRRTYPRTERKNRAFAERYPQDVDTVARIADRLAAEEVLLPDGDRLTVRRFQNLGIDFGMKPGYERLHWLLDEAFDSGDRLSDTFLAQVWGRTSYVDNPSSSPCRRASTARPARGRPRGRRRPSAMHARRSPRRPGRCCSRARWSTPGCSRRSARSGPSRVRWSDWRPRPTGTRCTTPLSWRRARCRSPRPCTSTTCTWTRSCSWRRSTPSAGRPRGSRTSTSTTGSRTPPWCAACSRWWTSAAAVARMRSRHDRHAAAGTRADGGPRAGHH